MNWLLQYYKEYHHLNGSYRVFAKQITGLCSLGDKKACEECPENKKICTNADEGVVLKLDIEVSISKVDIEQFFLQFDGTKASIRKKCDIMLYNTSNVILCDMTCTKNKYVESYTNSKGKQIGKRATAYEQIESVINALTEVPDIKNKFDDCSNKVALFALRLKDNSEQFDNVENNMMVFESQFENSQLCLTDMGNNFQFKTITYPQIYKISD